MAFNDGETYYRTKFLIEKFGCKKIYETGTFEGNSTLIMSSYGIEVHGIEVNEQYYNMTRSRVAHLPNVTVHRGSSETVLADLIEDGEERSIFFLDAHWEDYWPILDELRIIGEKAKDPIIIIHDFYVPDESGCAKFYYDGYDDQPLDFEYVKAALDEVYGGEGGYTAYYNTDPPTNIGVLFVEPKIEEGSEE